MREADDRLTAKLHRAPSLAELAEATGLPENKVANLRLIDIQGVPLDTFTTSEDGYCQESGAATPAHPGKHIHQHGYRR